jgi:ferrochelatase
VRLAVVLFNLGGPDAPEAVRPFLVNLFSDPAIIRLPAPLRVPLARLLARRRAPVARMNYDRIGGRSPILPNTEAQARALEGALADLGAVRAFPAMRYWRPQAAEAAAAVKSFAPDRIVLLPLYPQFSTTTTASSLRDWRAAARRAGLAAPTRVTCCWPAEAGLVAALADLTRRGFQRAAAHGSPRVLFSAHGLPERVVQAGDPYAWQVERTAAAVVARLGIPELDHVVCYQSRVGPLRWIGPETEQEIANAGRVRKPVVVVPVAFVSEHSETLVELDIDYRARAEASGVPHFERVGTVSTHPEFIAGLATVVRGALARDGDGPAPADEPACPGGFAGCARRAAAA